MKTAYTCITCDCERDANVYSDFFSNTYLSINTKLFVVLGFLFYDYSKEME